MPPRTREEWGKLKLGKTSSLILGWRSGSKLNAGRLGLGADMDAELRKRAEATLNDIEGRVLHAYEHNALLEDDEVFLLTADQLPTRRKAKSPKSRATADSGDEGSEDEASALLDLLSTPHERSPIAADDVRGRTFLFYAAVFAETDIGPVAFIKYHNPGSILKAGRLFGRLGQTVTQVEEPILVFEPDFDLVIDGEQIASLRPNAIVRLFADLEIAAAAVPQHLETLAALPIKLPDAVKTQIESACSRRRRLSRRLDLLVQQPHMQTLTVADVRSYLRKIKVSSTRFIKDDQLCVVDEDVADLLDVLDQRNYRGGYDDMLRRADRTSVVTT